MNQIYRLTSAALVAFALILCSAVPALATVPVAASFSTTVPANRQSLIQLQGSDAEGTSLVYATTSTPAHGALSNLNTATGYVVYTPTTDYVGSDSFTYTVTSGGQTSAAGTVTIAVTNAKTTVTGTITDASGNPRAGKVTFILTQAVTTPAGLTPVGSSVSATLNASGTFSLQIYPSRSLSPAAYYQVWFADSSSLKTELLGVYDIPASTTAIGFAGYKVTDTNLAARYTFASVAGLEALTNAVASAAFSSLITGSTDGRLQLYSASSGTLIDSSISESASTVTVSKNTAVTGNLSVSGNVTATNLTGNGAGITGLTGATGGVGNTGSTTIGADTDANGVGVIDLQTRNATGARLENNGDFKVFNNLTFADGTSQNRAGQRLVSANVKDAPYYASGSANTYTCSISSGTTTLTCTASTDFVAGQGLSIPGAAAAAATLFTTVSSGSGTTWTVGTSASTTATSVNVKHDETDAFNAALAAVFGAGGGTVYVPKGFYRVNKPTDATSGGVIYPPQNAWTGGLNQTFVSLALVGEVKPSWGDYGVIGGGVVIQSSTAGTGTLPAILSAKAYSASYADNTWNYVDMHVENILFRTYDNPTLSAVNLGQARRASVRNVIADVGVTETTGSSTAASEPTNNSVGIVLPKSANNGQATVENATVTGYRFGFQASDHFRAEGFVMAARCLYGYSFTDAAGAASGILYSYRNTHDFFFNGSINFVFFTIQSEVDTTSGTWTERDVGTTVEWSDTGDITHGVIFYKVADPIGVAGVYKPKVTGLSAVNMAPIYSGKETTLTHTFKADGTLVFPTHIVSDSVALSGGTATVTFVGGAVFTSTSDYQCSGSNFSNANPFKIAKTSATQITITGTGTDIIMFTCVGK
jgi:hypothetical protein